MILKTKDMDQNWVWVHAVAEPQIESFEIGHWIPSNETNQCYEEEDQGEEPNDFDADVFC